MKPQAPVFTKKFLLICVTTFLMMFAQFLVLTSVPLMLRELNYSDGFIGVFVGIFALGAMFVRVPVGSGVDRLTSRPFRVAGANMLAVACLVYMFGRQTDFAIIAGLPIIFITADLMHSAGFGIYGTAAHAFVGYTAPALRRGESVAYYGVLINLASGIASGLSLVIVRRWGFSALLSLAAVMVITAAILSLLLHDPPRSTESSTKTPIQIEKRVLPPALANMTLALVNGTVLSFVILLGVDRGLQNPGIFFTVSSVAAIASRFVAGRIADTYGRLAVIIPGMLLMSLGLLCISLAYSMIALALAGIMHGVGYASANPGFQAMAIDMAHPMRVGGAMATYFALVDLGVSLGSISSGQVVSVLDYGSAFTIASVIPVIGLCLFLIYLQFYQPQREGAAM